MLIAHKDSKVINQTMKILIDLNHPAHFHYCKNFIRRSQAIGHEVCITTRERYPLIELLNQEGFEYINRGKGATKILSKIAYLFTGNFQVLKAALKFKPDCFIAFNSPYAIYIGWLLRKPAYLFDDTDHAKLDHFVTFPFATKIFTPKCYRREIGEKQIRFNSYLELAYLHPKYFIPKESVLNDLKINPGEKFIIFRFVAWQASHDVGHNGISLENKIKAAKEFSKYGRVIITSEEELPKELKQYQATIEPHKMHDAMYYASLLMGESATMASEAAMLGTPSIFIDNDGRGYTDELEEKYGLVFNFTESITDQTNAIDTGIDILNEDKKIYQKRREVLLSEKESLTDFMLKSLLKRIN